jgi:phosphoribulokinase
MACFITPMATGIITTVFRKKIPAALKISWLNIMLWGGVAMLVIDHIANGEIVLYPPFLTAMQNPAAIPSMVQEIVIVGGTMTLAVVLIWAILVAITSRITHLSKQVE